ncbi:TMV resistance protein N-like [Dorcoceras hygrometricum]|uniref:TMV resistance protein N-like n=1 Tax=Dorcoceras hygrometricum TaxID=472368 RepID=A0A2Z7ANR9_9LAMI|nr:TMV resistance protein N-like [Dorcoceras hygrometricum]
MVQVMILLSLPRLTVRTSERLLQQYPVTAFMLHFSYDSPFRRWKVPLEEFDPQTQSPSLAPGELLDFTPALGCVSHLFYAYVRKATNTEFNVFVLGRDLILHFGFEIHSLYIIAQLSRM